MESTSSKLIPSNVLRISSTSWECCFFRRVISASSLFFRVSRARSFSFISFSSDKGESYNKVESIITETIHYTSLLLIQSHCLIPSQGISRLSNNFRLFRSIFYKNNLFVEQVKNNYRKEMSEVTSEE